MPQAPRPISYTLVAFTLLCCVTKVTSFFLGTTSTVSAADTAASSDSAAEPVDTSYPFDFSYHPVDVVENLSENVTLRCSMVPNNFHFLEEISWITILKEVTGGWILVGDIETHRGTRSERPGVKVTGNIDSVNSAYLEIQWDVASSETFGVFKCVIHGFYKGSFHEEVAETLETKIRKWKC